MTSSATGQEPGWGCNKYTFRKISQIVFSQGFASAKRMYFRKLSQICCRKYLGFASFRKFDFAGFRKLSRKFAGMVLQRFAIFRKLLQFLVSRFSQAFNLQVSSSQGFANALSIGFASAKIMVFRKDSQLALC